jgi:hypothetical protein
MGILRCPFRVVFLAGILWLIIVFHRLLFYAEVLCH